MTYCNVTQLVFYNIVCYAGATGATGGVYGGGLRRGHDEVCVLRWGRWFLISIDSAILRFGTSLQTFSIDTLNDSGPTMLVGCVLAT